MNRPAVPPLWRAAPLRLLRTPGWLLLLVAAVGLFVASVVAPPLFVATALGETVRLVASRRFGVAHDDRWDLDGAVVALSGMAIIAFAPR